MTYHLNPELEKIVSPITLILPDGEHLHFTCGIEATKDTFDKNYGIVEIRAVENTVEVTLFERTVPNVSCVGDETFF